MKQTLSDFDTLPDAGHVRLPVVAALYACSEASVWRGVKSGRIPKPRKYFDRACAWNVGELRQALK